MASLKSSPDEWKNDLHLCKASTLAFVLLITYVTVGVWDGRKGFYRTHVCVRMYACMWVKTFAYKYVKSLVIINKVPGLAASYSFLGLLLLSLTRDEYVDGGNW